MAIIKEDWKNFDRGNLEGLVAKPEKTIVGWESRTIYFLRGGSSPASGPASGPRRCNTHCLRGRTRAAAAHSRTSSKPPRTGSPQAETTSVSTNTSCAWSGTTCSGITWGRAGAGQNRARAGRCGNSRPRVANRANSGFWKDLKDKYKASEIVVDAKNTDNLTRDDLRQLYCYLKPALGYWGFTACRANHSQRSRPSTEHCFRTSDKKEACSSSATTTCVAWSSKRSTGTTRPPSSRTRCRSLFAAYEHAGWLSSDN